MLKFIICLTCLMLSTMAFSQKTATPWIGVAIDDNPKGVYIKEALADTPAQKAGLQSGDIIQFIDDVKVTSPKQMIELVRNKGVGHKVTIKLINAKGKPATKELKLVVRPDLITLAQKNLLNKKAPEISLPLVEGKKSESYKLANSKKVTIVEFWATWCGACAHALPEISVFAKKHMKKIDFISISNEEKAKIKKYIHFAKKKKAYDGGVQFLVDADSKVNSKYFVPALPMFFVIDKKHVIRHIAVGTGEELEKVFKKALALSN